MTGVLRFAIINYSVVIELMGFWRNYISQAFGNTENLLWV